MSTFRADCGSCCGLCCVVPAQLAAQDFPVDKPAQTPCAHLDGNNRCRIHAMRRKHGYSVCEQFDCFGAGQWITQQLFGGAHWSDSSEIADQMFAAYRHWAPRFEAAALIEAALPYIADEARGRLHAHMTLLTTGETPRHLACGDAGRLRRETLALIHSALGAGEGSRKRRLPRRLRYRDG